MSKYNDVAAIIQVIGCVYNNPELLEERDRYTIIDEDFENEFHRVVFGSIYKLYDLGANKITLENILDFLVQDQSIMRFLKPIKEKNGWLKHPRVQT